MPNLGDYLGRLLSEITIARMQADIETVRVAEFYAAHPLLRSLPVPHFRLPNIELNVPVAIKRMEEEDLDELPRRRPMIKDMQKAFDKVIDRHLKTERIKLTPDFIKKLKYRLDRKAATLIEPKEIAIDVYRIADEMASRASEILTSREGPVDSSKREEFEQKLKDEARLAFLKLRKAPPRLQVQVTTGEIREAGPNEIMTRLNLKITEESVEWTTIETDGIKHDKLVIE